MVDEKSVHEHSSPQGAVWIYLPARTCIRGWSCWRLRLALAVAPKQTSCRRCIRFTGGSWLGLRSGGALGSASTFYLGPITFLCCLARVCSWVYRRAFLRD